MSTEETLDHSDLPGHEHFEPVYEKNISTKTLLCLDEPKIEMFFDDFKYGIAIFLLTGVCFYLLKFHNAAGLFIGFGAGMGFVYFSFMKKFRRVRI